MFKMRLLKSRINRNLEYWDSLDKIYTVDCRPGVYVECYGTELNIIEWGSRVFMWALFPVKWRRK